MIEQLAFAFSAITLLLGLIAITLMLVKGPPQCWNFPLPMPGFYVPMPECKPPKDSISISLCGGCAFYRPFEKEEKGTCRRYPPSFRGPDSVFPMVAEEYWCGEFRSAIGTIHTNKRTIKMKPGEVVYMDQDEEVSKP